jgi:hypothetical protein
MLIEGTADQLETAAPVKKKRAPAKPRQRKKSLSAKNLHEEFDEVDEVTVPRVASSIQVPSHSR